MTARTHTIIRYAVWSLPVLLCVAILWQVPRSVVIRHKDHFGQIKQVGLALKLYAADHQGTLPDHLEDMMPIYFTKHELLDNVEYVSAGAKLPELPPTAVLARRPFPEDRLISVVHADMSAEAHKP